MSWTSNPGRVAGLTYLLIVLTGPFNLIYIPRVLFVHDDATATAANIANHELLFRLGIADGLIGTLLFALVGLTLYWLFEDVHRPLATLLLLLVVISSVIGFITEIHSLACLMLVRGANFLNAFDKPQRDALAYFFLRMRSQTIVANEMLWGLWLVPFAALLWRSRLLPRFMAVWLYINAAGYVAISLTGIIAPQFDDVVSKITAPALWAELVVVVWLIVKGGEPQHKAAA